MVARSPPIAVVMLTACVALVGPPHLEGLQRAEAVSRIQLITASELRRAGVYRLGDVVRLLPDWDVSTVDGYAISINPLGLSSFEQQGWLVLVDGQVLNPHLFGSTNLNLVPVTLSEIDSIRIVTVPQFYSGQFASNGLIHFYSHRPSSGFVVSGRYAAGQESGDPGPFRSTELATPNLEQSGPDYSATVGYGTATWYVSGTASTQSEPASDVRVSERNGAWGLGTLRNSLRGGSLRFGVRTPTTQHDALLGRSNIDEFHFLAPFGREIPNNRTSSFAGLAGQLEVGPRHSAGYRVAYERQANEQRENAAAGLDFDRELTTIQLELSRRVGAGSVRFGGEQSWLNVTTAYQLAADGHSLTRAYGVFEPLLGPAHRTQFGAQVTISNGAVAFAGVARHHWSGSNRHTLSTTLAYAERLPEQDDRIWLWNRRGYRLLEDLNHTVLYDGDLATSRRFSADVTWSFELSRVAALRVAGFFRNFLSTDLQTERFLFQPSDASFFGSTNIVTRQDLEVAGGDIKLRLAFAPAWQLQSYFRHQRSLGGDVLARRLWEAYPTNQFYQTMTFTPVDAFSMWVRLQYRVTTNWFDYRDIDLQTNGEYSSSPPAYTLLDLATEKWFWRRRVRTSLAVRNLLNDRVMLHPIGATLDLGFYVQVELLLGPIQSSR